MPHLRMKEFKVKEETDEAGQDSPYFVFFFGDVAKRTCDLKHLRQSHWDNEASTGDKFQPNTVVIPEYSDQTMVLCALLEEDDNADYILGKGVFKKIKTKMKSYYEGIVPSGPGSAGSRDAAASALLDTFKKTFIDANGTDDDFVAVHSVHMPPKVGEHRTIPFKGNGGTYTVTFDVVP